MVYKARAAARRPAAPPTKATGPVGIGTPKPGLWLCCCGFPVGIEEGEAPLVAVPDEEELVREETVASEAGEEELVGALTTVTD